MKKFLSSWFDWELCKMFGLGILVFLVLPYILSIIFYTDIHTTPMEEFAENHTEEIYEYCKENYNCQL